MFSLVSLSLTLSFSLLIVLVVADSKLSANHLWTKQEQRAGLGREQRNGKAEAPTACPAVAKQKF